LEDFNTSVKIIHAWDTIRKKIKIAATESLGHIELKKHEP
jgi:hypothetical protein